MHKISRIIAVICAIMLCLATCAIAEQNDDLPSAAEMPVLKKGDSDDLVKALQEFLIECNYLHEEASGKFDKATISALKDLQVVNGVKETGECDESTWEVLLNPSGVIIQRTVYKAKSGKVYHEYDDCSNMRTAKELPLSTAIRKGLMPCARCH